MEQQRHGEDEDWTRSVRCAARGVRRRVLARVLQNNGGYLSQACSSAEILATLYLRVMRLGPSQGPPLPLPFPGAPGAANAHSFSGGSYNGPRGPQLDRFFFSPVHYALALYAMLIEAGRLAPGALDQFNVDGSSVEMIGAEHSPGIETMAGSLGQTLSVAGGVALARRLRGDSGRVWVLMSDGELQEGQTWEALAAAGHHGLDRLGVYVDVNAQQCDGPMERVATVEPLAARVAAFGADLHEVDGHDVAALAAPATRRVAGKPLVVLCRTDPCRGIEPLRQRAHKLHHVRFADQQERAAFQRALVRLEGSKGSKGSKGLED